MTSDALSPEAIKKIEELDSWYWSKVAARERAQILPGLQDKLKNEAEPELRMILYTMIIGEHTRTEDSDATISTAKCQANEFPDDPLSWITLAEVYSHQPTHSRLTLDAIEKAIAVARRTGTFRRQALQTKARLLRYMKDFAGLERCLAEIIHEPRSNGVDIAKEDDFLIELPLNAISPELERLYRNFMLTP